jgi:hypothetical protein
VVARTSNTCKAQTAGNILKSNHALGSITARFLTLLLAAAVFANERGRGLGPIRPTIRNKLRTWKKSWSRSFPNRAHRQLSMNM